MDYPYDASADVLALREETCKRRACLIALSDAITQLDCLLKTEATGYSLEPLYARIPQSLRGFVELVYDLNNHPSFRLLEPLLYRSRFYDVSMQSLCLSTIRDDDRPFILSTPRLRGDGGLSLPIPFADPKIDSLFQMKTTPRPAGEIQERLGLTSEQSQYFETLLTEGPPPPYERYCGTGARWRYFGHACVLFETAQHSILIDPVLSYTYDSKIARYTYDDLPDHIDCVLITHNHQDHVLFETLLQIRHKVGRIIVPRSGGGSLQDPSLRLIFKQCGFSDVIELDELEEFDCGAIRVTGVPFLGEHCDLDVRSKLAYLLRVNGHSVMFAADSCNIEPEMYRHVRKTIGDVDVLFLGMECDGAPVSWLYGPLLTQRLERKMDFSRRLAGSNYAQALAMIDEFRCKEVYVYAMGQEPWLTHVMSLKYTDESNPIVHSNRLIETARSRGMVAERLFGEKEILIS
jgi:L-ascorbate metabolism protein UlaG (beta-lactamase superfamily)